MAIKKIRISNFKSFKNLEVELGKFNVLIGANASGKSNFIRIFEFLRDIKNFSLSNAISMQGGVEYLRNINIGSSELFSVEVVSTSDEDVGFSARSSVDKKKLIGVKPYETIYKFALKFTKRGQGFKIVEDNLILRCNFVDLKIKNKKIEEKEKIGQDDIIISKVKTRVKVILPKGIPIRKEDIFPPFLTKGNSNSLLLELIFFLMPFTFADISIYDFDPKLPKMAVQITGKSELEGDGSNLAIVLKNIIKQKDNERKFSNFVEDLLPFVAKLDVEKFADKSLLFKLREIYSKNQYLPASLISDGTINITALIIALYFEEKPITIIEEPERNIHPYLISKIVNMMKDASQKKQIIVTTHNPEVVKHADLENILMVSRNKDGFSIISKPSEKEEVKTFLENEIGIEELYVQNLLGI